MIPDQHPVVQAFLGTLVTWGLTAAVRPTCDARGGEGGFGGPYADVSYDDYRVLR